MMRVLVRISNLIVNFHNLKPSLVAATCLMTSRRLLGITPIWRDELKEFTGYS